MKIKNGLIFGENQKMIKKDLCFEDGIICENSKGGEFDAEGYYVLPGFIDTHIHGSCDIDFSFSCDHRGDIKKALDYLSSCGVTSIMPTTATNSPEELKSDIERIVAANDDRIIGIHAEGPFVNPVRKGGMNPDRLQTPSVETIKIMNEASNGLLKILTMAPELDGADKVIDYCNKNNINLSLGHTDTTFEEAQEAVNKGYTRLTHTYNAMRPFSHRDPGVLGFALTDSRVNCELICDLHHVSAAAIKLAVKAKGAENITMISDSLFFAGLPEGAYGNLTVKDGFARLPDGTICGSACNLAVGAKNMFDLGFSPSEIATMACVNPARAAGATDRGELKTGMRADIIILDKQFNVTAVFQKGKRIK